MLVWGWLIFLALGPTPLPSALPCASPLTWPACDVAHVVVDGYASQGFEVGTLWLAVAAVAVALICSLLGVLVGYTVARR